MAIDKLSIGEVNSGPFLAIDSLIERINAGAEGTQAEADIVSNVEAIADTGATTAEAVGDKVNELIAALVTAGVMEAPAEEE